MAHERPLRVFTLLTTAIAMPLLIATTIVSLHQERTNYYWSGQRQVTAFCFGYLPLTLTTFTSAASLLHHRKHGRSTGPRFALLDAFAGILYLSILLPIWAVEVGRLIRPGFGLLTGYLTAPMIVNMFIHFYFFVYNAQSVWLALSSSKMHECPNCRNNFVVGAPQVQQTNKGPEGYSLLRGEVYLDEDAVPYRDSRASEDQIRPESEAKGEGKGKAVVDV